MLNTKEFYADLGAKAAEARNQRDESRAQFHFEHFRRARALEDNACKTLADTLYREAYEASRNVPRPDYFK